MPNAARFLTLAVAAAALAACHKQAQPPADQNAMSPDVNVAAGQLPPNAEIETLPPDESSEATNAELSTGDDNPDVNNLGNSH